MNHARTSSVYPSIMPFTMVPFVVGRGVPLLPGLGRRVLVVDDDLLQARLASERLEAAGFVVDTASGVRTALESLRGSRPDAIVSDVVMDEIDGFSLCRILRQDPSLADVPIILVSAYFDADGDQSLAREVGAIALVERSADLRACVAALVIGLSARDDAVRQSHRTSDLYSDRAAHELGSDLTELALCQQKLEASERRYRALVENTPAVLWSARKDGTFSFISPNVARLCGTSSAELVDGAEGAMFSRIHPDDVASFRAGIDAVSTVKIPLDAECRWSHRDGRWLWLHCRAESALDAEGNECIEGVFSDVTARKLVEEQTRHSQKVEAIGQVSAGLAHDFNNVLAVILANSEFLVTHALNADGVSAARDITNAAERAAALTEQMFAFSRREASEPAEIDLNAVVADFERSLSRVTPSNIAVAVVHGVGLGAIRADAKQLEQVLTSLAANARDAMPGGGRLTIETSAVTIGVSSGAAGKGPAAGLYAVLSVGDTGVGMSTTTLERIFDPFFTTKIEGRGTGLGLSTSYGIVRRSGGHITVDSALGAGTTFRVFFPLRSKESGAPAVKKPARAPSSSSFAVKDELYVRLDALVRERTSELELANQELESFSYSVSHDLRAPIRAIQGFTQAAIDDAGGQLDDGVRKHLSRVQTAATRMNDLIEALLDLSRVVRAPVKRSLVDVTAVVREIEGELRDVDPSRNVQLVVQEGLTAEADPRLLRILLVNLMSNAWKFTSQKPLATVEIGKNRSGEFFVKDDGVGFDMKMASRLFEPFQRLCSAKVFRGTGVGLATVMRVVRRHGGHVRGDSRPGEGATFVFSLQPQA